MENTSIKIAIVGATGYTGEELVRLLLQHPQVQIEALISSSSVGTAYSELYPEYKSKKNKLDLVLEALDIEKISQRVDAVFLCLPHGKSAETAAAFYAQSVTVFDLSADFRLHDQALYEQLYLKHPAPELLEKSVYALPEFFKEGLKSADLIACPGCYPTSILLALAPLLKQNDIQLNKVFCDSKSGMSGAGRKNAEAMQTSMQNNFKAYAVGEHRHQPEVVHIAKRWSQRQLDLLFVPHLLPIHRGILSTVYIDLAGDLKNKRLQSLENYHELYNQFYEDKIFVKVLEPGQYPELSSVQMTNYCEIALFFDESTQSLTVISAIDNLIKGASGQAIQAFNIRYGLDEKLGLS